MNSRNQYQRLTDTKENLLYKLATRPPSLRLDLQRKIAPAPSFPPSASWVLNSLLSPKTWSINKSLVADPTTTEATLICVYCTFCSLLKTNERICSPKDCSLSPNSLPLPINLASFFTLCPTLITVTSYSNTATTDKNTLLSKSPLDNTMDTP